MLSCSRPPIGKAWWRYSKYFKALNRDLDEKIALLCEWSIQHPEWLGKLGLNMNFRQFLSVIIAKNLSESEMLSPPWGTPSPSLDFNFFENHESKFLKYCQKTFSKISNLGLFWVKTNTPNCDPSWIYMMVWSSRKLHANNQAVITLKLNF